MKQAKTLRRYSCREIQGRVDPARFLKHLGLVLPDEGPVAFEMDKCLTRAPRLYERFRATQKIREWYDSIWPETKVCHVNWTPELKAELLKRLKKEPVTRLFRHIKVYHRGCLWVWFHDAYLGGYVVLNPAISPVAGRRLAEALRCRLARTKVVIKFWAFDCRLRRADS